MAAGSEEGGGRQENLEVGSRKTSTRPILHMGSVSKGYNETRLSSLLGLVISHLRIDLDRREIKCAFEHLEETRNVSSSMPQIRVIII
jgi:hypothetical protein